MGYTNYTVRDGHDKRLALMLCVASSRIVHNPALRKRRCNYRDFYNSPNTKKRILIIDTSEEVISEGEYIANRKEAIHGIAIYYRTSC